MARKKGTTQTAEATSQANGPATISKQEAVRLVLAEYGPDTSPTDIVKHVKEKFGLDMTTDHASTTKSAVKRELAGTKGNGPGKKSGRPKKSKEAVAPVATADKASTGNGATKINLDDIHTIKELVKRVGAQQLQELIKVLTNSPVAVT